MLASSWVDLELMGMGETGGVELVLSGANCWTGSSTAGVVVEVVTSMGMEERVALVGGVTVVGAEVLGLSWKGFNLSIRSVFVPDTGRPRSFSSSFSSAT